MSTKPVVTVTKVEIDTGGGYSEVTSASTTLTNTWGDYYDITNPTDVHDAVLILHSVDVLSGGFDTDNWRITFNATNSSQTRDEWYIGHNFNSETIPTETKVWSAATTTTEFLTSDLDTATQMSIVAVAKLDDSEFDEGQTPPDVILQHHTIIIDTMPTIQITNAAASMTYGDDEIFYDVEDAAATFTVNCTHDNFSEMTEYSHLDAAQGTYTSDMPMSLHPNWYFIIRCDRPYDNNATNVDTRKVFIRLNP